MTGRHTELAALGRLKIKKDKIRHTLKHRGKFHLRKQAWETQLFVPSVV
jgi:hypothetical protein